jgi:MFS family permease
MVQGFSLGGEIGCNTAYLMEAAPSGKRGGVVAWQGASQNLALIAGGSIGVLLTLALPARALDAYGWRIAFLLGAVAIPFGVWLRRNLPETLDAPETGPMSRTPSGLQERHSTQEPSPSRLAQARAHWRVMLIGLVVLGSATIGNYSFSYIVTYAQNTLHFPAQIGFLAATFGYILSIPVMLLGGRLSDRYGRRPVNIVGNLIFLACIYPAFVWVIATRSPLALILGMTVLNGLSSFNAGSFYAGLAESLPKTIRGGGFGTVYSTAIALFGGTTQLMVTWLIHATGSAMAPAWYMIGATVIGQVGLWLMPESAPARLAPGFAEPKVAEIPA